MSLLFFQPPENIRKPETCGYLYGVSETSGKKLITQQSITCSNLTKETLEQAVKYVQS